MTLRGNHNQKNGNSSGGQQKAMTDGQRHGSTESSGAESWRSTDTVRGPMGRAPERSILSRGS